MKLLVCDIEGTIFKPHLIKSAQHDSYIWTAIAEELGKDAEKEEILTQLKWKDGGYGSENLGQAYMHWVKESIAIHKKYGLTKEKFEQIIENAPYVDGVQKFFKLLNRKEYIPIFISGGIQNLSEKACRDLGVDDDDSYAACKYYFNSKNEIDKTLTFLNTSNFYGKQEIVSIALKKHGLTELDWLFIGDGINDVSVAKYAPISIGIDPINQLKAEVDYYFNSFEHLMESSKLVEELNLLNPICDKNQIANKFNPKINGHFEEIAQQTKIIAIKRVERQVGNLELSILEKRSWDRMGIILGKKNMNDFKMKAFGI